MKQKTASKQSVYPEQVDQKNKKTTKLTSSFRVQGWN